MKFPIPSFICLGLFVVASIVQLFLAFTEKESLRRKQKFTCVLFLALFAFFAFPNKPLIYIGALFGMIGDVLNLNKKTYVFGVLFFYLSHFIYIFEAITDLLQFNIPWYIILIMVCCNLLTTLVEYFIVRNKKTHGIVDKIGQALYFSIQVTYIPLFIYTIVAYGKMSFLCLIGAILFIISDSIYVKVHYDKPIKRQHFYVMSTYLAAELLLVLGFVLNFIN